MSSQGFSFPPPPPPPPSSQQQQQSQSAFPSAPPQYGYGSYGQRGGRGAGGHNRGRGRGFGNRGGRGGSFVPHHASHNPTYSSTTPSSFGYGSVNYTGFTPQSQPTASGNIPTSQIASLGSPGFQHQSNTSSYASPHLFAQPPAVLGSPYQPQSAYEAAYAPANAQSGPPYPSVVHSTQHVPQPLQAPMMSPPMRWGFEQMSPPTGPFASPRRGNQWAPRQSNTHQNQSSFGGSSMKYGGKRDHTSAFGGKPQAVAPRVPAPPPVPSFGNPLPVKPPPPAGAAQNPRKKKRKHNQLGLTPKTEEHESSEEEDDVDEESKLAPAAAGAAAPLQFTYKGRTATLQSPTDIAAWIEERKKRFPTQAKVEEKKKAMHEAKKAREEALNKKKIERQEQRQAQKVSSKPNDKPESAIDPADAAAKAKREADKLQRKLLKEQKRVAKAEADAERARLKVEKLQKVAMEARRGPESATQETEPQAAVAAEEGETKSAQKVQILDSKDNDSGAVAVSGESSVVPVASEGSAASSSDDSDSTDWTSSSGSDISPDSDESDDDSAPEEVSSRREGPERVPPPPRVNKKQVCRHFSRHGRCFHGEKCNFLHELPERGVKKTKPVEKKGRRGLFQALIERQKEEEDRRAMEVIIWLGDNGFLDAPETKL